MMKSAKNRKKTHQKSKKNGSKSKKSDSAKWSSGRFEILNKDLRSILRRSPINEVEPEDLDKEDTTITEDAESTSIFALKQDPSQIRVAFRQYPIDLLITRLKEDAINFSPGYQRSSEIWNTKAKSRLIESLLIKIPLPVFYIDSSNEDRWDVIDGIQRLSAFKAFAVEKTLKLKGLEFLPELEGKSYDDIPRSLQRRFLESYISLYLIEKGTPERIKQSIYERINTGGTTLNPMEIRYAVFQGAATQLLDDLTAMDSFELATNGGINPTRMADKEIALRFVAFYRTHFSKYQIRDMDKFLTVTMEELSKAAPEEISRIKDRFKFSMNLCHSLFDKTAFRKPGAAINKALFETWSSSLAHVDDEEAKKLIRNKKIIKSRLIKLLKDPEFIAAISTGTGDVKKVQKRFSEIEKIVKGQND